MNKFKKNQLVVYAIVLMLIVAGYLSYIDNNKSIEISSNSQNNTNIGDATLVSNNETNEKQENVVKDEEQQNTNPEENNQEQNQETSNTHVNNEDDYFTNSKLEREKMYSQMLETYQKILENTTISEEQKAVASKEITNINNTRNAIMICENLMQIKGFDEAVILANGENINVVVKAKELGTEDIAQLQNIITREMSTDIENIHIMKK